MQVQIVGTGEAFDSGLGNNAFLLSGRGIPRVLIDCGYQVPERLWASGAHKSIDAVYLTHTHGDHAFGIVPLLARYWLERRTRPLTILGHAGVRRYVERLFALGYPSMLERLSFPIEYRTMHPRRALELDGLRLTCARSRHSVPNLSVRFEDSRGRSVAFSGDGDISDETRQLYAGVDVLFHELYRLRRSFPGHTRLPDLRKMVESLEIPVVVVSHHARRERVRIGRAIERLPSSPTRWIEGRPGERIPVPGPPRGPGPARKAS